MILCKSYIFWNIMSGRPPVIFVVSNCKLSMWSLSATRNTCKRSDAYSSIGLDFIIRDIPSVLKLILADQILDDSLCSSYKCNWCICRFIDKLYILSLTFRIPLPEVRIMLNEIFLIQVKMFFLWLWNTAQPIHNCYIFSELFFC